MAKYLVGSGSNCWNLINAMNAARNGDTIVFQQGYTQLLPTNEFFIINKSLTFEGQTTDDNKISNKIIGKIMVESDIEVNFNSLKFMFDGDGNIFNIHSNSKVKFESCIIEHTSNNKTNYPVVFCWGETDISFYYCRLKSTVNDIVNFKGNKLDILNSSIQSRVYIEGANENFFRNSTFSAVTNRNAIYIENSKLLVENCEVFGEDYNEKKEGESIYPAIFVMNSDLTLKKNKIIQPDYGESLTLLSRSILKSEEDEISSIDMDESTCELNNSVIREIMSIRNLSYAFVNDKVYFKGDNDEKIDLLINDKSSFSGNEVYSHVMNRPIIRIKNSSSFYAERILHKTLLDFVDARSSIEDYMESDETSRNFYLSLSQEAALNVNEIIQEDEFEILQEEDDEDDDDDDDDENDALKELLNLVGLTSVKKEVERILKSVEFNKKREEQGLKTSEQSLHSVFIGNPGTGKTTVARLIGQVLFENDILKGDELNFVEVTEADLVSENIGGTPLKTQEVLESARGGVLFIDEAYTLNKKNYGTSHSQEAIETILKFMEDNRNDIMIIFAGYTKEMEEFLKTNPGLSSRIANKFIFEDYTADEIVEMGEQNLIEGDYVLEDREYYERSVKRGYNTSLDKSNGRWIRNFNEKLLKAFAERVIHEDSDDISTIKKIDIDEVFNEGRFNEEDSINKVDPLETLNNLIGISKVKEQVEKFISITEVSKRRVEQSGSYSEFSMHSMFLGNPGTGKTTVARILGEILYKKHVISSKKFVEVSRSDLVGEFIGHTAIKTREVLESALGGVLFIDEAYTLAREGASSNDFGKEAIDEILKFMEDHRQDIVIIFAGYTKEMQEFLNSNSGLASRIPHTFDFEDYSFDELVKIGLLDLNKRGFSVDEDLYSDMINYRYYDKLITTEADSNEFMLPDKQENKKPYDNSNGRWVRNLNEELIGVQALRLTKDKSSDLDIITREDIDKIKGEY